MVDTYNHDYVFEEAIDSSVLTQDFPPEQMEILVDDGSTDVTADRARKYGDRIQYFSKPNVGQRPHSTSASREHAEKPLRSATATITDYLASHSELHDHMAKNSGKACAAGLAGVEAMACKFGCQHILKDEML